MDDLYYRVKYGKKIIARKKTRQEALDKCDDYAKTLMPVLVNPSTIRSGAEEFIIELVKNGKVISTQINTVIVSMKK